MPQLGETVLEATVTRWLKKPGDRVEVDEPLVEVSTDKVDSEIPSPSTGALSRILVQEGETVLVGAVMAEIKGAEDESASEGAAEEHASAPPTDAPPSVPAPKPPVAEEAKASPASPPRSVATQDSNGEAEPFRKVLSPLVRKLAAEHGVDLDGISGTGSGGRITKQDILDAAGSLDGDGSAEAGPTEARQAPVRTEATASPSPEAAATAGREEVIQIGPMRKAIAEHMVTSVTETARAWNTIEVDLTRVARLRERAGPAFKEQEGFSLTWMPFVCKALTQALLKFPQLNSTWNGDGTITRKRYVNLGVAVALENGLIVPVIKGADAMNLIGLARAVREVADRARGKKLTPEDVQGGTFTLTNPGGFGSIMSMAIINRGQTTILAFDAVVKRPVVLTVDGEDTIAIRHMAYLSISWDHRVVDGAEAAQFLSYLRGLLEEEDFESDLSGLLQG